MDATNTISFWNRLCAVSVGSLALVAGYMCLASAQMLWPPGKPTLGAAAVGLFVASMALFAVGVLALSSAIAWRGAFTARTRSI